MNESFVTVVGNMIGDPVLRTSKHGKQFATFRVASTIRRRDPVSGAYADGGANYVSVVVFNGLAVNASASLRKGEPVIVYGRLRVNQWVGSQNQPMTSVEVEGHTVGHDLTWGQTTFAKGGRTRPLAGVTPQSDSGQSGATGAEAPSNGTALGADPRPLPDQAPAHGPPDDPGVPSRADYTDVGGNGRGGEQGRRGTGGFDRTVEDAETDPYDVVTHGLRTS